MSSGTRRARAPGAQSLVSERPKRGHPGDSVRASVTPSRAWGLYTADACGKEAAGTHVPGALGDCRSRPWRITSSAAGSRDSGLGPQLGSGAQSVPCAHVPHFCVGHPGRCPCGRRWQRAGEPVSVPAGRCQSELRGVGTRTWSPHESWGGAGGPCVPPGKLGAWDQVWGQRTLRRGQAVTYGRSLWVLGIARACSLPPWTSVFQDGEGLRVRCGDV